MISPEKRKYDRVKRIRARDNEAFSDMIAGNKASDIDPASPVVFKDGPEMSAVAVESSPSPRPGDGFGAALTDIPEVITTTRIQTIAGNGGADQVITQIQILTILPESETQTTANTISQATSSTGSAETTAAKNIDLASAEGSSGGLSNGAKIGIGVAVPIVFILLGLGIFLFFRRRKQQRLANKEGGVGEVMITGGKHHDEDGSSGGIAGSPTGYHSNVASQGVHVPGADVPVPVVAPVPRSRTQEEDDDLMNRPVSPVHDDDLLSGEAASSHSVTRSGTALGGSVRDRGSPSLDDDREMQWILEEERKAKERREQQGRLPTHT